MAADCYSSPGCSESEFIFRNINLSLNDNHIIRNVSGMVQKREILGIFGPKGSGKSALVSTLAGHLKPYIGEILLNGEPVNACRNRIAFVQSRDLFLPTLTVYETLYFTAKLRLSSNEVNIKNRVKQVIDLLHLQMYLDFIRYDNVHTVVQVVTTAVKKKLSIACEMLIDPKVIVIDTAFYGTSAQCDGFLQQLDTAPPIGHHPMDYMLELLNEDCLDDTIPVQEKIVEAAYKRRNTHDWPDYFHLTKYHAKSPKSSKSSLSKDNNNHTKPVKYDAEEIKVLIEKTKDTTLSSPSSSLYSSSYWNQFWTLFCRNFTNARRRILFPISVIQNVYILVVCILVWWQPERTEETVKDRLGLFFFTVVQWAFFSLLDGILTFPKEIKVVNKERKYNHYRLSAFCLSKTLSEIPLTVIQPFVYLSVIYWVANLNNLQAFFASLGVLMADVLAAQSIGVFIGAALRPPWTVTMVPLGGAFNTPPSWFSWGRFASFFYYGLNAFIYLEFKDAKPIKCGAKSMVPVCNMINPATNSTYTEFDSDIILLVTKVEWPLSYYLGVLLGIFVITKILWYIAMRKRKSDE
ncbi:Hypothetical predicted protein [Mytilus galloprovincialis]|uniref:ABC transporter domain-containing protein n=1 Tax=Mytilus galloprovincialis TaxID=29158 RepID=A0A8B6D9C1_MYTGA|nr:Hypothetical predicted protein [Mytilus galloprovincialis]